MNKFKTNKDYQLYCGMMNNSSSNHSDDPKYHKFNSSIKFTVDEYIGDEVPIIHECSNMDEMIKKAYELFLNDKLNSIGIYDRNKVYNGTEALNFWRTDTTECYKEIDQLKEEIEIYKEFIKTYKANETFKEYKKQYIKRVD